MVLVAVVPLVPLLPLIPLVALVDGSEDGSDGSNGSARAKEGLGRDERHTRCRQGPKCAPAPRSEHITAPWFAVRPCVT